MKSDHGRRFAMPGRLLLLGLAACGTRGSSEQPHGREAEAAAAGGPDVAPPAAGDLTAGQAEAGARETETVRRFLDRYSPCEGCTIRDEPGAPPRIGCVSSRTVDGCEMSNVPCPGESWIVQYWVGPACSFRFGQSEQRITVELRKSDGRVLRISPALAYVATDTYCESDADCRCLSGSGVPFLRCANLVHAPLHFAGSYECDRCRCISARCR